jgi:hypothetical protein
MFLLVNLDETGNVLDQLIAWNPSVLIGWISDPLNAVVSHMATAMHLLMHVIISWGMINDLFHEIKSLTLRVNYRGWTRELRLPLLFIGYRLTVPRTEMSVLIAAVRSMLA